MIIEAKLSNEDIEKIVAGVVKAMVENNLSDNRNKTGDTLLDSYAFADKTNICYPNVRKILNKRMIPSPVHIVIGGKDQINERLFDEWIADPNNAWKLERI